MQGGAKVAASSTAVYHVDFPGVIFPETAETVSGRLGEPSPCPPLQSTPWQNRPMNIQDWQKSKVDRKRSDSSAAPSDSTKTLPARLDVLEAEFAAAASRPRQEENEDQKSES